MPFLSSFFLSRRLYTSIYRWPLIASLPLFGQSRTLVVWRHRPAHSSRRLAVGRVTDGLDRCRVYPPRAIKPIGWLSCFVGRIDHAFSWLSRLVKCFSISIACQSSHYRGHPLSSAVVVSNVPVATMMVRRG